VQQKGACAKTRAANANAVSANKQGDEVVMGKHDEGNRQVDHEGSGLEPNSIVRN